jgi:hypothetical protein
VRMHPQADWTERWAIETEHLRDSRRSGSLLTKFWSKQWTFGIWQRRFLQCAFMFSRRTKKKEKGEMPVTHCAPEEVSWDWRGLCSTCYFPSPHLVTT